MAFWVYENWTVVAGGKARIHREDCDNCNYGRGKNPNSSDRNGKWHGPFTSENIAMNFANSLSRKDVRRCKVCFKDGENG